MLGMHIITAPLQKAYLIRQPGTCAKDHRNVCDQKIPKERVRGRTRKRQFHKTQQEEKNNRITISVWDIPPPWLPMQ